ncbi:MAG: hypothetical protein K2H28_04710 [Ruminococcus sp.]|nr:hypothetical protein [Ruminococcus sp.]
MISDNLLENMSREELIQLIRIYSKNWLAMDGAWFQAVEKSRGMDEAMLMDSEAWKVFTVAEARRIKKFLNLPEQAGLDGLAKALKIRFYGNINTGEIITENNTLIYKNTECFVQTARKRKNMEYHPCKTVGIIEYSAFAKVIDNRIYCECISCYPDITDNSCCCAWKFILE